MKKTLIIFIVLLPGASALAQEYGNTANVTRSVAAGAVREEKAVDRLTATNTLDSGATVHYTAGQSITLQPGFVARAGSVFQATIGQVVGRLTAEPGTTLTVRAFPNPFETTTTVEYNLPESLRVTHTLTDAAGRLIKRSGGQEVESVGPHRTPLDVSRLPVGVYLYQVETTTGSQVLRLLKK